MGKRFTIKNHFRETQLFTSRAVMALVLMISLTLVIISRLIYLQVISHDHFTTLSQKNRVNIVALPPTRGLIYDRNGALLAQNLPSFSVEVVPEQVINMEETLTELKKIIEISEDDEKRFRKLLQQKRRFESVPLRFRLSEQEVARFAENRYRFPGVDIEARLIRDYPLGSRAVHAIGYVGRISEDELQDLDPADYSGTSHIGKTGVEKSYEDALHGTVGFKQVEINATGRALRVLDVTSPIPGKNLYLTIDAGLQSIAEDTMSTSRGAVIAIEPRTGDILAFVSTPTFDPNPFVNGIDAATYAALETSPEKPLFNRALRGQYPPGSTIKPLVALAGLEYGKIVPTDTTYCPGWYTIKKGDSHRYRDWKHGGHGTVDMGAAIMQSCDVYFYDLALDLGIDRIHSFLGRFGLGRKTGIDIAGELPALLPSREWKRKSRKQNWYPGETIIVGIGQGYMLTTPLQLASVAATIATRGSHMQPRIVRKLENPLQKQTTTQIPIEINDIKLASEHYWDGVIQGMSHVVHHARGTAKAISIGATYRMAGKTGTAQVFSLKQDERYNADKIEEALRDHALFIAFAPVEAPRIAVAILVENGGSGSGAAAPIARKLFDFYLQSETTHGSLTNATKQ